jgi:tape measure domain-containing protein
MAESSAGKDEAKLVVRLEASVTQLTKELTRARQHAETEMGTMARGVDRSLGAIERRRPPRIGVAAAVKREAQEATSSLAALRNRLDSGVGASFMAIGTRAAGAVAALVSADKLRRYADSWQEAANKIAAAGEATENVGARQSELADLAIRSRSDLSSVVDLYTGLRRATADLGATQAQVLQVTETVSKGFVVGGQSAATAAGAIIQLNQAFQSGKLSGDELNSVLEGAPPIARLIAKEFGVGVGELKKLAEAGKLTSDRVFGAILEGAGDIEAEFAKTNSTISQSFTNLTTALTRYIGEADQATGASRAVAGGIQAIADNIDVAAPAIAVLAATLLGAFAGPVGAGIAGTTTALALFGDSITPIANDIATLGDYGRAALGLIQDAAREVGPQIGAAFQNAAELATQAFSKIGEGEALPTLLAAVKAALNATIGAFVSAALTIQNSWTSLGPVLVENITAAMNAVVSTVQAAINKVVGAVNSITSTVNAAGGKVGIEVGLGKIPEVNLGQVTNRYAGAGKAAGEAYGRAFDALSLDYVGSAIDAGSKGLDALRARANRAAAERLFSSPVRTKLDNGSLDAKLKTKPGDADGKGKGGSGAENEFEREVAAIEKRARAFDSERESLGRSAKEAAKAEASFRLLEAAKKANLPVTDELRGRVDTLASAYAAAKVKLDEAEQAQRHTAEAQRYLGAAMTDAVSDLVLEGRSAAEVFESLTKSLAKAALQAALMGTGPLSGMFGGAAPQSGGAGGLFGSLISAVAGGAGGSPTGGVRLFAGGGIVTGRGTGTSDDIPAMISNGEAVIPARAVANNRSLVEALIADRLPRYASGLMPASVMMSGSMKAQESAMNAVPQMGAMPASPGINAPISITMQGSSGDAAVDRAYIEQTAAALREEMRSVFHQEQTRSLRTNGTLWKAGLRRSS